MPFWSLPPTLRILVRKFESCSPSASPAMPRSEVMSPLFLSRKLPADCRRESSPCLPSCPPSSWGRPVTWGREAGGAWSQMERCPNPKKAKKSQNKNLKGTQKIQNKLAFFWHHCCFQDTPRESLICMIFSCPEQL